MHRMIFFLPGFATASLTLPRLLDHHTRAEVMNMAWCSSSGSAGPDAALFAMHCAACPLFVAGIILMAASLVLPARLVSYRPAKAGHA